MRWGGRKQQDPEDTPRDIHRPATLSGVEFQQGLMMREIVELRGRVDTLERHILRQSMRPAAKTAGLSGAVAGSVFGILELLRYIGVFK